MKREEWRKEFSSISEMIDWCHKTPVNKQWLNPQSKKESISSWRGTKDLQTAEKLARNGWPEGAKKIKPLADLFYDQISSMVEQSEFFHSVEPGVSIDIGSFCAGEPDPWLQEQRRYVDGVGNRVISVTYNASVSGSIHHSVIINRGAVVVAMVQALELAGYSVELNIIDTAKNSRHVKPNCFVELEVRIKSPDQPLNVETAAFAIMNPAMERRLFFAVTERCPNKEICKALSPAYGVPALTSSTGDIYFSEMNSRNYKQWGDSKWVANRALEMMKEAGVHFAR